jgi:heme A synthase
MKLLLRLALAADAAALTTLMLGSWTRINGAGLTCPDWPLCRGHVFPSMADGTVWEWTHRLLAFMVAPLIVALLAAGWQQRRRSAFILPALTAIALLFFVQVFLGAETVRFSNAPISVVAHWATAMALIAAISALAVFAAAADAPRPASEAVGLEDREVRRAYVLPLALSATAAIAFVTMCVGAYVSSSGAGLACLSIPGCAGNVVVYTSGQYVQMLHRVAAAVTLISATGALALVWAFAAPLRLRATVLLGVALVSFQVLLGLLNVAWRLPTNLREAHAVNAALVFLAFFVAAVFAVLEVRPIHEHELTEEHAPS